MFHKWFPEPGRDSPAAKPPAGQDRQASSRTALVQAAQKGDLTAVMELVRTGMDLKQRDERGGTALHYATCGHYPAAEFLLTSGADTEATDDDGLTPLHVAFLRHDRNMMELLVKHGADIHKPLPDGRTIAEVVRDWQK